MVVVVENKGDLLLAGQGVARQGVAGGTSISLFGDVAS
jgi:hypothetical protein